MPRTKHDPDAVDGYLDGLPDDRRRALEELRQLIKTTVPGAQERISYGTSVIFALKRDLVGFAARRSTSAPSVPCRRRWSGGSCKRG
jgi:uncharacterized protein YdhG (YjbR/CyaY superfamily)